MGLVRLLAALALVMAGYRSLREELSATMQASTRFEHFRLPEVFAGYDGRYSSKPVGYPGACNPQAWAAAATPHMFTSLLSLRPDGFGPRLAGLAGLRDGPSPTRRRAGGGPALRPC